MPLWSAREIEINANKLSRPFETMHASNHFIFSHGHLAKVARHDSSLKNVYEWEELWMTYTYWKKGFTLYAPIKNMVYYNYD